MGGSDLRERRCRLGGMGNQPNGKETNRKQFAHGSALGTYQSGSVLLLESNLARVSEFRETAPKNVPSHFQ
jgi:hypothetical protein